MSLAESVAQFRARRRAAYMRHIPATFKAILSRFSQSERDMIENQLESMYYYGWLEAYREFRDAQSAKEQNE